MWFWIFVYNHNFGDYYLFLLVQSLGVRIQHQRYSYSYVMLFRWNGFVCSFDTACNLVRSSSWKNDKECQFIFSLAAVGGNVQSGEFRFILVSPGENSLVAYTITQEWGSLCASPLANRNWHFECSEEEWWKMRFNVQVNIFQSYKEVASKIKAHDVHLMLFKEQVYCLDLTIKVTNSDKANQNL